MFMYTNNIKSDQIHIAPVETNELTESKAEAAASTTTKAVADHQIPSKWKDKSSEHSINSRMDHVPNEAKSTVKQLF